MSVSKYTIGFFIGSVMFVGCKKEAEPNENAVSVVSNQQILTDFSINVAQATYNDLEVQAGVLLKATSALKVNSSQENLIECRKAWVRARLAWEQSEGFLFGPVATQNIDPRIDTWPVSFSNLESVLANNSVYDQEYINQLEDALKGFHPIEYLIYGLDGNKNSVDLTPRELDYLVALSSNLKNLTVDLASGWNVSQADNYTNAFNMAGNGSTIYGTTYSAYEELVNAMSGICEEVAGSKLHTPFILKDPMLEESPFLKIQLSILRIICAV